MLPRTIPGKGWPVTDTLGVTLMRGEASGHTGSTLGCLPGVCSGNTITSTLGWPISPTQLFDLLSGHPDRMIRDVSETLLLSDI